MKTSVLGLGQELGSSYTFVQPGGNRRGRSLRRWLLWSLMAITIASSAGLASYYWPRKLPAQLPAPLLTLKSRAGRFIISIPGRKLIADLADFDDGFFAYLMFDHYRSQEVLCGRNVLLISDDTGKQTIYRIEVELPNDLIAAVDQLAFLRTLGLTSNLDYNWYTKPKSDKFMAETQVFVQAFQAPSQDSLALIQKEELQGYLRRFITFKSLTDPRTRRQSDMVPSPLTRKEADRLAANMIAVADFYGIPLDLMLGIGAMENNYLSVPGDLENTKWKRRPQLGDIVLRRARRRVLVKNDSTGVWQITRESLRYAHQLYLKDHRDYSSLPERLHPPREFTMESVTDDVLTTYAGLLLRDLLDRFNGDVILAAGAYNGTVDHPNLGYAMGVETVATYARNVIECAAAMNHAGVRQHSVDRRTLTMPVAEMQPDSQPDPAHVQ